MVAPKPVRPQAVVARCEISSPRYLTAPAVRCYTAQRVRRGTRKTKMKQRMSCVAFLLQRDGETVRARGTKLRTGGNPNNPFTRTGGAPQREGMPSMSLSPEPYMHVPPRITPVEKPPTRVQNPLANDTSFARKPAANGAELGLLDFSPPATPQALVTPQGL